jgi:hypothetical protein
MALTDYRTSASARSLHFFTDSGFMREQLDVNPPYQRGVVWGTKRKRNLIRSLLSGIPIPSVVINDRSVRFEDWDAEVDASYVVVDGKQRITTLRDFVDGKLSVPGHWFDVDADEVLFTELDKSDQRHFLHRPIAVSEAKLATLDEEREMFDLINFGGLAQGEVDDDLVEEV